MTRRLAPAGRTASVAAALMALLAVAGCREEADATTADLDPASFAADWASIDLWPGAEGEGAVAEPDPARITTVIVLDDSGSMENDIESAKRALVDAVALLPADGRIAVLGLNSGTILAPTDVMSGREALPAALAPVRADGMTPLGAAVGDAYAAMLSEARGQRGFGTYRMIVTTDGDASDGDLLATTLGDILRNSPVQVVTIGVRIGPGHVLNMPGRVGYVAVDDMAAFGDALVAAAAEQADFAPMTGFEAVR